jgi:4-hydroxybenzoate polyprenyltransferase
MTSLKNVLLINGASSGATGLILIAFGRFVAAIFGVSQPQPFWAVGIFLIAFAALVIAEGLQPSPRQNRVILITTLDTLWVIGSVAIAALQMFNLSAMGYVLVSGVALWVAAMAVLQARGLKKVTV